MVLIQGHGYVSDLLGTHWISLQKLLIQVYILMIIFHTTLNWIIIFRRKRSPWIKKKIVDSQWPRGSTDTNRSVRIASQTQDKTGISYSIFQIIAKIPPALSAQHLLSPSWVFLPLVCVPNLQFFLAKFLQFIYATTSQITKWLQESELGSTISWISHVSKDPHHWSGKFPFKSESLFSLPFLGHLSKGG